MIIDLNDVEVRKRQRTSIAPGPLAELRESILARGNLHPPVCYQDGSKWVLVAGERRCEAIKQLWKAGKSYRCGEDEVPPGKIKITTLGDYLDEEGRFSAELDENTHRVDLEWQDKVQALAALHEMRKKQNSEQTVSDTARELVNKGVSKSEHTARKQLAEAEIIARNLGNQKVAKSRTMAEALQQVYKTEHEAIQAALVKRKVAQLGSKPLVQIVNADLLTFLPSLDAGQFDLLIADPPYGIGADAGGFRQRTVQHHNYEDTAANAREIAKCLLTEGFRITKPGANIFIFCDIDLFQWLKLQASNMGWSPFRRPLIWIKSETEGLAPWGSLGPRVATEFIFYATKGQRGLVQSPMDSMNIKRVPRNLRIHAAEKPVELMRKLIDVATLPGDYVLDPCCGSGSSMVACMEGKRRGMGIEKDNDYYNTALSNVLGKVEGSGNGNAGSGGQST